MDITEKHRAQQEAKQSENRIFGGVVGETGQTDFHVLVVGQTR